MKAAFFAFLFKILRHENALFINTVFGKTDGFIKISCGDIKAVYANGKFFRTGFFEIIHSKAEHEFSESLALITAPGNDVA